jgi:hypothetical protein
MNDAGPVSGAEGQRPGALRSLGYAGRVRLHGRFGDRLARAEALYSGLSTDDILHGFRVRAGMPSTSAGLGGWASETSEMTFGQWVSGLSRMSAVSGNREPAERALDLLSGYFATLPRSLATGMSLYAWEKLLCGVVDATVWAGFDGAAVLPRLVEAMPTVRDKQDATPTRFMGSSDPRSTEWYTLGENLLRAAAAAGDPAIADRARAFAYPGFWRRLRDGPDPDGHWRVPAFLHAYSHVNSLSSAAAFGALDGDPAGLEIARAGYDWACSTQCFATGGFGPREFTTAQDGSLGASLEWTPDSAEIVCGTWAAFKLASALVESTGSARFLDWAERLLYNGIGSCIEPRPDGRSPYYDDYRLGSAAKLPYPEAWPCCSGSYAQAVPHVANLVYFSAGADVHVGLYLDSEVRLDLPGSPRLVQRADLLTGDSSTISVRVAGAPVRFRLRLRVPPWTDSFDVRVNGERRVGGPEDGWFGVDRLWTDSDEVAIAFGSSVRAVAVDPQHPSRVAIVEGPIVLAQEVMDAWPLTLPGPVDMLDLPDHLRPDGEGAHSYRPVAPGSFRMPAGRLHPLADYPDRRPYCVYHDVGRARLI